MSAARRHRLLLWCAATDRTFTLATEAGRRTLTGRCIHCGRRLRIRDDGRPLSELSLEHIVPRTHGGGDNLSNLAIACPRCNAQKGARHDLQHWEDPKLQAVIATLTERRRERMRPPPPELGLPPFPGDPDPPNESPGPTGDHPATN